MKISKKRIKFLIIEAMKKSQGYRSEPLKGISKKSSGAKSLKKIGVYKTKKGSVIGGESYLKFIQGKTVYALDTDGVLYSRVKGSGQDFDPLIDSKEIQAITKSIIDNYSKSGFVNKVKEAMLGRSKQAKSQDSGKLKELLAKNFRYIPGKDIFLRFTGDSGDSKGSPTFQNIYYKRWDRLLGDLRKHLKRSGIDVDPSKNKNWQWSNGSRRGMNDSYDTKGNSARIAGTNHGFGFAIDIKYHVPSILGGASYKTEFNKRFAKNQKFVKALHSFSKTQNDLIWGGTWGGSDPENGIVKGRGVIEIHHWELKPSEYGKYLGKDFKELIGLLGFQEADLKSDTGRADMYRAIEEKYKELFGEKNSDPEGSLEKGAV